MLSVKSKIVRGQKLHENNTLRHHKPVKVRAPNEPFTKFRLHFLRLNWDFSPFLLLETIFLLQIGLKNFLSLWCPNFMQQIR